MTTPGRMLGAAAWLAASGCATAATLPPAPVFPPGHAVDVIQGVRVADPYRALENGADPAVEAWSEAENARTRAFLDALPGRAAVAAKIARLTRQASPAFGALQARGGRVFALYTDPARQQPVLVAMDRHADPATRRVLLDPNALDPAGHTAIDWYAAAPDGGLVAVSLSRNGSEIGTLYLYDLAGAREIGTPIDRVQYPTAGGAVAWTADGRGFWYTRCPGGDAAGGEPGFNQALFLHRLDAPAGADRLVLGAGNGLPRTAEITLDHAGGGADAIANVELGDGGRFEQFVLTPDGGARQISRFDDGMAGGAVIDRDGVVYAVSRQGAPMGKVVRLAPPYAGGLAAAPAIVPERPGAAIIEPLEAQLPLVLAGDRLLVNRIVGGPGMVTSSDLRGGHAAVLRTPPVSAVAEIDALPDGNALLELSSFVTPPRFVRWNAGSGDTGPTGLVQTSPCRFDDVAVTRLFALSRDGTRVPVTVIARRGLTLDGSHPLLLYGYGGFAISETPVFLGAGLRTWLDAGGVYADANIRGGGEYGEPWHRQGMLLNKQTVFDDFDAVAGVLIRLGYTSHDRLALRGGSNGGLLMGATLTRHPELARAVVSQVGLYDMLRFGLDPNGAFNVGEFGSVEDPAQFRALYAYSPYQHVRPGTPYPAVLMMTGAIDGRVNPVQSRKLTAALQAATSSGRPILLRTTRSAGHGIGSSLEERIATTTDWVMFLLDQLGMSAADAAR